MVIYLHSTTYDAYTHTRAHSHTQGGALPILHAAKAHLFNMRGKPQTREQTRKDSTPQSLKLYSMLRCGFVRFSLQFCVYRLLFIFLSASMLLPQQLPKNSAPQVIRAVSFLPTFSFLLPLYQPLLIHLFSAAMLLYHRLGNGAS